LEYIYFYKRNKFKKFPSIRHVFIGRSFDIGKSGTARVFQNKFAILSGTDSRI